MSKIIIEIETTEDAKRAQKVINAILGNEEVVISGGKTADDVPVNYEMPTKKTVTKKEKAVAPEPEEVEESKPEPEDVKDELCVDLKQLTQIAKDAVGRTDRITAKDVISKYGGKLSDVDESDYSDLAKELEALGV